MSRYQEIEIQGYMNHVDDVPAAIHVADVAGQNDVAMTPCTKHKLLMDGDGGSGR
jgi:hypothetical protein